VLDVEGRGIPITSDPCLRIGMFGMVWISHGLDELLVARHAAAIVRGSRVGAAHAHRQLRIHRRQDLLELDAMLPGVAEVVEVIDRARTAERARQLDALAAN